MSDPPRPGSGTGLPKLVLGALGVVFGDIGTSPLYALRECFSSAHAVGASRENVLGVLSLVFWALLLVVGVKYVAYVMRADNRGEGGILALMALAHHRVGVGTRSAGAVMTFGLIGAALLYGDGMITPAISVLSAVEGLRLVAPELGGLVIPITVAILVVLFSVQHRGTERIGNVFGPITALWFLMLAALGIAHIVGEPAVLVAISPVHAISFLVREGGRAALVVGSVFLVVTGGEALYADMGHFGLKPIRFGWFALVAPSLLLNYFGQGALLLADPGAAADLFFRMVPAWAMGPAVALATAATVIASQAMISGTFSVTRQAMMLGYWPRVRVDHTSTAEIGQIYVSSVNWLLMVATVGLVLGFRSSASLASAYGIAVSSTMVLTTLLAWVVARRAWGWPAWKAGAVTALLLVFDLAFFGTNALKIADGGWLPIVVAVSVYLMMTTWRRGRAILGERVRARIVPLEDFYELVHVERPARVPGTAVFMTGNSSGTPPALLQNFQHNKALHSVNVLLTVQTEEVPRVPAEERVSVEVLRAIECERREGDRAGDEQVRFVRVVARYGFTERPDVPRMLAAASVPDFAPNHATYFLGRETLLPVGKYGMVAWRERLFAALSRNAEAATAFFNLPPERVLEIGSQIEL
ncbi:MAG: potassium transporter Kup [Polyangiaceae bacterium]|nr:potassium transporter Kup [Polyangiaceae bacterium]